ncbi:hypothetical protein [Sanyastnella coralliicola]|uniref:hypothetical protein n=1 Tax=Sanyastnella coralliicola TaxID=3069118 RepID=UPI0027BAD3B0|nr:hypothetical protein [Longitalea sp. SCSIO 12813]
MKEEDLQFIDHEMSFLLELRPELKDKELILPLQRFFPDTYRGTEEDARIVIDRVTELCDVVPGSFKLEFEDEGLRPLQGLDNWESSGRSSAGLYEHDLYPTITISRDMFRNFSELVSTTAHELSHLIYYRYSEMDCSLARMASIHKSGLADEAPDFEEISHEERIHREELLTDILTIMNGFGIFLGNSSFHFSQWSGAGKMGWQTGSLGYLPTIGAAYVLAKLEYKGEEKLPDWVKYMSSAMKSDFKKTWRWVHYVSKAR